MLVTGLLAGVGCGSPSPPGASVTRVAPPARADAPVPAVEPAPGSTFEDLVVGSDRGLEAWDRDGNLVRLISPGRSRYPRFVDDDTLLVIVPLSDAPLARGFRIESVERQSGERTLLSVVPELACKGGGEGNPGWGGLGVSHPGDFAVDAGRGFACISLYDAYREAATFGVELRMDLTTGAVRRWVVQKPASCVVDGPMVAGPPEGHCVSRPYAEPEPELGEFGIASSGEGVVVTKGGQAALLVPGYERELVSPSGSWVLLRGDVSEGDYVHRRLALLHLRTGRLYPIPTPPNPWPNDIARVGVDTVVKTPIEGTREAVGQSAIGWLGSDEADELLVIDDLVVRPGRLVFFPQGEVAR